MKLYTPPTKKKNFFERARDFVVSIPKKVKLFIQHETGIYTGKVYPSEKESRIFKPLAYLLAFVAACSIPMMVYGFAFFQSVDEIVQNPMICDEFERAFYVFCYRYRYSILASCFLSPLLLVLSVAHCRDD